jgi:hypothetical protein
MRRLQIGNLVELPVLHNPLLLEFLVFLEVKLDNFPTREGIT